MIDANKSGQTDYSSMLPVLPQSKCPATMCKYFAKEGSPWTGQKDADCEGSECGWFHDRRCVAPDWAMENIESATATFDAAKVSKCEHDHECQRQRQSDQICPPRFAIACGKHPSHAKW